MCQQFIERAALEGQIDISVQKGVMSDGPDGTKSMKLSDAFSVFKKYCSPPDETFPFPYLTKVQFEVASLEVIKMAGFRYVSESITQKMEALAKAADEDKNGVIQWGEWYCVSDAIISAVKMAKAQNSK